MAVRVQPRQLAFALPHAESLTRDNFLEGPANEAALSLIESWPDWPNRIMLLVGPEGSGKTISPRSGPNRPARARYRRMRSPPLPFPARSPLARWWSKT